jgi:hypothetical protein
MIARLADATAKPTGQSKNESQRARRESDK